MTRYDYVKVTVGFNVEFDHDGENEAVVNLTDAARADPRWLGFIELFHELRNAPASGPPTLIAGADFMDL